MNERIQELRKQAWDYVQVCDERYSKSATQLFDEKFSELIVRECMDQVYYGREDVLNGNISEVIQGRIKEHFGVKE